MELKEYVKAQLAAGYSRVQIRESLLAAGYSPDVINSVLRSHLSVVMVVLSLLVFVVAVFLAFLFLPSENSLEIAVSQISPARPGGMLEFYISAVGSGSGDVSVEYVILRDGRSVFSRKTFLALNTKDFTDSISLEGLSAGKYELRASGSFGSLKSVDSFVFEIKESKSCPSSCDDKNECTEDFCSDQTDFVCLHKKIADCGAVEKKVEAAGNKETSVIDDVNSIVFAAVDNPDAGKTACMRLDEGANRDYCFKRIADATSRVEFCDFVSSSKDRDFCILNYVLKTMDTSVCSKINGAGAREQCSSLA